MGNPWPAELISAVREMFEKFLILKLYHVHPTVKIKRLRKSHPRTGHESPEGNYM